jgi:hypothetical protein
MKQLNKSLLPKKNKYTHKEILDLSTPVNRVILAPVSPVVLTTALFVFSLGFIGIAIPGVNPLTMTPLAKSIIGRYG